MKLVINLQTNKMRSLFKFTILPLLALFMQGCSTTNISSCEKLAKSQKSEIRKMVKRFEKSASGKHVLLLETGSGISDLCRSHFIEAAEFTALPSSASSYCVDQERDADTYCTVYSVDGKYRGESVN